MATLSELITTLKGKMLPLTGGTLTGALTAPSVSITNDNAKVNGKNIVRSVNGTVAGTDGNVTLVTYITKTGDRGSLAGYETLNSTASAVTISDGSADDTAVNGAVAVTVSNGTVGKVWTKTVGITNGSATISLGSSWYWVGGKVPTVAANSVLVLKWYGTFGVANLILTA